MSDPDNDLASQIALVGCCGAYCGPCLTVNGAICKGCKLGYDTGIRDLNNARCAIKRCCLLEKKIDTCADCPDYEDCRTIRGLFEKNGYKYGRYKESIEFIRQNGYPAFITAARSWKRAYGRLKPLE